MPRKFEAPLVPIPRSLQSVRVERGRSGRPPSIERRSPSSQSGSCSSVEIFEMDTPPVTSYLTSPPRISSLSYIRPPEPTSPTYHSPKTSNRRHRHHNSHPLIAASASSQPMSAPRRRTHSDIAYPVYPGPAHRTTPGPSYGLYAPPPRVSQSYSQPIARQHARPSHGYSPSTPPNLGPHLAPSPRSSQHFGSCSPQWYPNAPFPSPPSLTHNLPAYDAYNQGGDSSSPLYSPGVSYSSPVAIPMGGQKSGTYTPLPHSYAQYEYHFSR